MNLSAPFVRRPVGTVLLTVWIALAGIAAFFNLPVASLPQEDFPAIAYTMIVDGQAKSYLCHDLETRVWHNGAPNANTTRLSVCWIGITEPTEAQIASMAQCCAWLERQLRRALEIRGHKDAPYATQCPGKTWAEWKPRLLDAMQALPGA